MPEKIGKYEIIERLGRGGMGTIFKAHDPVLDRFVAVKVISTDIEITDELRARFFREAKACARLSHPNIVTVYAMGDNNGQLFIVMELLEGEELKHLIAQRKVLALQDKLSIMVQVCDGLHYAHQNGIVHRDIKPGNIFLLPGGQVKILDFGIAKMASAEGGLTRAGLIMGSVRYMSPEQVRGRVDHRSDIFSLGAVLYEFLSMRPPFTGKDPVRLLEQLRTEEPPALDQLDPTIPSELAAVVARAMRKDPAERFTDLEQMRSQLEEVQRGLTEEARRLSARVLDQRGQLLQLRAALAERMGPSREDEPVPTLDERAPLATIQALESDVSARIEALQARITRADSLAPALRRATELLQAGQSAEAAGEFETILAEMPEHARALDGLEQARAQVEVQRRRQLAAKLAQDARAALDEGNLTLCLEILEQAAQIPPPAEAVEEIASLRGAAEAAVAAREVVRRARQEAEGARAHLEQTRRSAQSQAAPQYARGLWDEAEAKSAEAEAAFGREAYTEASEAFEAAAGAYRRVEEVARAAQERQAAEGARAQMAQVHERAEAAGAPLYTPELWAEAQAKFAEAEAAFSQEQYATAADAFDLALALYKQAEQQASEARCRQRDQAEQTRQAMAERRRGAAALDAASHAPSDWQEAEASAASGEAAFAREAYAEASGAFHQSAGLYHRTEDRARDVVRALEIARAHAETVREAVALARHAAEDAQASKYASEQWRAGESTEAQASATLSRQDYAAARSLFSEARRHFEVAAQAASIAAEVEAHRADAMVSDARRFLDSGDVAACLRRLSEVLELRPGHAGAEALRREAELKQREAATTQDAPAVLSDPPTLRTEAPTEHVEAPTVLAEPAVLGEATIGVEGPRTEVAHAPGAPVEAMPPRWPTQRRGKSATGVTADHVGKPAPGSRWGSRRLTMAAVGGLAVIGLGALLWLPQRPSTGPSPEPPMKQGQSPTSTASPQPERPAEPSVVPASPQPERPADPSVVPPSPRIVDNPLTPRQALREVFEGRNPAHAVTATVVKDAVRIGRDNLRFGITSTRPGYVYVMVVHSNGSDVELLLPNALETNNYIKPGRLLKLPGPQWPLKAQGPPGTNEFLAIVSDEPRDFSALGPASENVFKKFDLGGRRLDRGLSGSPPLFAGTVACVSATRCSESYGAVVFSIDTVGREPEARPAARRPPAAAAPPTRATQGASPRCSNILERASLGDLLTDEEQTILTRDCR